MLSDPVHKIEQFMIPHGATVVDLGAGSGFYSIAAAEALKGSGTVYAVDIQKDTLEHVMKKAHEKHLSNVQIIWGDCEIKGGVKLHDHVADCAILSNILFQAPDKAGTLAEAKRLLKPSGKLLLIDWSNPGAGGPNANEYVPEMTARELAERTGFRFEKSISAGTSHYGMILRT